MPESIIPPRMIVKPNLKDLQSFTGTTFSFRACCKDPKPAISDYDTQKDYKPNSMMTGYVIYCEYCDMVLLRILWNKFDMEEYQKIEDPAEAAARYEADAWRNHDEHHSSVHPFGECPQPECVRFRETEKDG